MLLQLLRPRLFVSYSRSDRGAADILSEALQRQGCIVWIDRKQVLVGDDFVRDLSVQLGRQDGLVLLLTETSARSSWCHAEVQHALACGKSVFVVQRDADSRLPDALERLLRDIQRLPWDAVLDGLGEQIRKAAKRRWMHLGVRACGAMLLIAAAVATVQFAADRVNALNMSRRVNALIQDIGETALAWSGDEVRSRVEPLRATPGLTDLLRRIAEDPARAATVRVNAWQALNSAEVGRQKEWRFHVPQIRWKGGRLADTVWANTTYTTGDISDLKADHVRMAGLLFGAGPTSEKEGMSLARSRIVDADIWFLRIDGTQMMDVEFLNSKFRGAQLDLSGAAGLRFLSRLPSSDILSPDVSIMEDSWIIQRNAPPEAGILDMGTPEKEIIFDGVQFVRVRFEGYFKPEWFRNNHFTDCVFATGLTKKSLSQGGNSEERSIFLSQ
ncbi:toll/interleukin-1 receptor domain-containing protein [Burkholderia stagnalis]|uniref:toll/interleukin-1 receptor domain-containing protein n=1 Tax=Burkholderia stagnalis TaxID=1503054 RepID=UPI002AB34274|nr:toll/interleukin-1 receptor domain-containing protein [Burkholderia stagnalis]MDY7807122.1 toll/interleukin-1 receptor domain-containing protein [Burkholderia stagnalis]